MALQPFLIQQPELAYMPNLVVKRIADYVGFPGVVNLLKVNQRFRNLLQDHPPTVNLNRVVIIVTDDCVDGIYGSDEEKFITRYIRVHNGCQVTCTRPSKKGEQVTANFYNKNYRKIFLDDIKKNLMFQSGVLTKLEIQCGGFPHESFLTKISEFLGARKDLLKTKAVHLAVWGCEEIHLILPLMDPTKMQHIEIRPRNPRPMLLTTEEMDKLASLEQWKAVKGIFMNRNLIIPNASIHHFYHLTESALNVESFGFADFLRLKQKILSFDFTRFRICFQKLEDEDQFIALFGEMFRVSEARKLWSFHIPNNAEDVFGVQLSASNLYMIRIKYVNNPDFYNVFRIIHPMFEFP